MNEKCDERSRGNYCVEADASSCSGTDGSSADDLPARIHAQRVNNDPATVAIAAALRSPLPLRDRFPLSGADGIANALHLSGFEGRQD